MKGLDGGNDYDGYFITIEGIDGAGKSTIIQNLDFANRHAVRTREPSPHWTGEQTRRAIDSDETPKMTDFFQFMSDRAMHNKHRIIPVLKQGDVVVCDRYIDSTLAYQGVALQGVVDEPKEFIQSLTAASRFTIPDLTILVDISPETSVQRSGEEDKYEKREFIGKVHSNYHDLLSEIDRMKKVDGEQRSTTVVRECQRLIDRLFDDDEYSKTKRFIDREFC